MIWESGPWKEGLSSDADRLESFDLSTEAAVVDFEKTVFLAGFAIRKLLEAKKLSDRVAECEINCEKLLIIDQARVPDRLNWHRIEEFYDISNPVKTTVRLAVFTNQLIHSFVFGPEERLDGRANGILVTSDYDRRRFLYRFSISEITRVMRLVGNDYVVLSRGVRDEVGDWIFNNYGPNDPEAIADRKLVVEESYHTIGDSSLRADE